MKKLLYILIIIAGLFLLQFALVQGATTLFPYQGGTGIGTVGVGDVGKCLIVSDDVPFTYTVGECGTGGGGSGGGGFPLYVQNDGATLNTATTTLNFTANSFSLVEDPTDTFAIRVATSTLGLLTTNVAEGSNLYYTDARVSTYMSASSTYTNLLSYYTTPSSRITAGTGIDWSGNTLNGVYTAGDGVTLTGEDFDCDTASGSVFGCLSAANWTTFNSKQDTITAGDALTLTGTDIDFDGGASPSGDLGGTWASPSVTDDSHAHTASTISGLGTADISGLDISDDTNLSADGTEIVLTGDALSLGTALTFTSASSSYASTTGATNSNLTILSSLNIFGGGAKTTANALCIQLTGAAGLCDGSDDGAGGGGEASDWQQAIAGVLSPTTTVGISVGASSTIAALTVTTGTTTNATSTTLFSTLATFTNAVINTLLTTASAIVTSVLQIPNGTGPTADDPGEIAHDTSDNQLILDDYVVGRATERIWGATIASTSPYFIGGTNLAIPTQLDGYTMTAIRCYVVSGTSKAIIITDGTNATESITCGTTITSDDGSIANAGVTAAELMYIDFGSTSGAVDTVSISVFGNWTRE